MVTVPRFLFAVRGNCFASLISFRGGFVLPLVLGLIVVMAILGTWFFLSTLSSKNAFQIFFRDDKARIIAESALAEWRATFQARLHRSAGLRNLFFSASPRPAPVVLGIDELPRTREIANTAAGSGQWTFSGEIALHSIDRELFETVAGVRKRGTFGSEGQATVGLLLTVGLRNAKGGGFSRCRFIYEFDVKMACLRSPASARTNRGYSTNALNDYVLLVRGGRQEFDDPAAWSAANAGRALILGSTDSSRPGRVYVGNLPPAQVQRLSPTLGPADPNERLRSELPQPGLIGRTGPVDPARFQPFASPLLRSFEFKDSKELFSSPLFANGVLKLNGIVIVGDAAKGLVIPPGTRYEGMGVLISRGNIEVQGEFLKKTAKDGPCILSTWRGDISLNTMREGRVEASLVALRYNFDPADSAGPRARVRFSQKRAEIVGNLLVDALNLESAAPSQDHSLVYDSETLLGDERYSVTLGGRLKRMCASYDNRGGDG